MVTDNRRIGSAGLGGLWPGLALLLAGCADVRLQSYDLEVPAQSLQVVGAPVVSDGRARFRELFCERLATRSAPGDDAIACEQRLLRLSDEPAQVETPREASGPRPRLRVLIIPGLFGECFASGALPFQVAAERLDERGYDVQPLLVPALSSSQVNGDRIATAVAALELDDDERLVLIAHSKGVPDALDFLTEHPPEAASVAALVSVAGAVNGSALAEPLARHVPNRLKLIPDWICDLGDLGAFTSLRRSVRLNWLAEHSLPDHVAYFSLVSFTSRDNISAGLTPAYDLLSAIDPRNDGQLLFSDQVIPGSILLGYANADHWAVVYPLRELLPSVARTIANRNDYPREVLLQSILEFVADELGRDQPVGRQGEHRGPGAQTDGG